jgi:hypothetical protein
MDIDSVKVVKPGNTDFSFYHAASFIEITCKFILIPAQFKLYPFRFG